MDMLVKALIGLSVLGFLLAVIESLYKGSLMGSSPEAFSRACGNLALIAIALRLSAGQSPKLG